MFLLHMMRNVRGSKLMPETKNIKANWLLYTNSILIIILCGLLLHFLGYGIGSMYNPFSLCGIIFMPWIIGLACFQFDSTFRKNDNSALNVAILYFVGAGFALFALISNLVEGFLDDTHSREFMVQFAFEFGGVVLAVFAYCIYSGISNLLWRKKLKKRSSEDIKSPSVFNSKKVIPAFISLLLVLFLVGLIWGYNFRERYEFGEDVNRVPWLPDSASNICYYKSYVYTAYEFDISEQGFLDWAKKHQWEISEIIEPVIISRYNRFLVDTKDSDEEHSAAIYSGIKIGYYYQWERRESGGGIAVVYDSTKQRAYYQSNPR